jgi:serine/threonine protein kinase
MPLYTSSLRKFIATGTKARDWRFLADQGASLADAMSYAHRQNIKHRDLNPDNILFNPGRGTTTKASTHVAHDGRAWRAGRGGPGGG